MPRKAAVDRPAVVTPAASLALLNRSLSTGHDQLKALRPKLDGGLAQMVDEHLALSTRMMEGLSRVEGVLQDQQDLLALAHRRAPARSAVSASASAGAGQAPTRTAPEGRLRGCGREAVASLTAASASLVLLVLAPGALASTSSRC